MDTYKKDNIIYLVFLIFIIIIMFILPIYIYEYFYKKNIQNIYINNIIDFFKIIFQIIILILIIICLFIFIFI